MRHTILALALAVLAAPHGLRAADYVGVKRCKICHKKDKMGDQFGAWEKAPHSKAYESLGTDKAKALGAELGVESPQTDPRCLICHTTAHHAGGTPPEDVTLEEGVSCEACHGGGKDYKSKKVHAESREKALAAGMIDLSTPEKAKAVCLQCHSPERDGHKNPTYDGFDFEERIGKVQHPLKKGG